MRSVEDHHMTTSRRGVVGLLAFAVSGFAAAATESNKRLKFSDLKKFSGTAVLYHVDFGDSVRFAQVLNNITNHYAAYNNEARALKIVIVTHSHGVKYFLNDLQGSPWEKDTIDPAIYNRFVELTKIGLEAYLCEVTFKRLKIDPEKAKVDTSISWVPSGVAAVGDLQAKGYSYLKVG
jgi:intracellular sulfur oxidation DsrE/DsrF family protein